MRIISGALGGRRFYPPAKNWPTRPTTDIAKEGLFNILNNRLDFTELRVLDLFGGTGSHSLEFVSRGCEDVTYVDKHFGCVRFITSLSEELGISDKLTIRKSDVAKYVRRKQDAYDYIFAGPPYPLSWLEDIPKLIFDQALLHPKGLFVIEHNDQHDFSGDPHFKEKRKYGDTLFSFFRRS